MICLTSLCHRLTLNISLRLLFRTTVNNLRDFEPNVDRQKKLAQTLKNPEKLAKVEIRIEFLTACRKNDLIPRFIEDALRPVKHIFKDNERVATRSSNFAKVLLNQAIAESFRTKSFLMRERARLSESTASFLSQDRHRYILTTCARIYDVTIRENRPRLVKKFQGLKMKTQDKLTNTSDMDEQTIQRRVKNLSSAELDTSGLALLAKGPNFATTQTISKAVLLQVEKGIERFAYAKRWKDKISRSPGNSLPNATTGPAPAHSEERSTTSPSQDATPLQQVQRSTTEDNAAPRGTGGEPAARARGEPAARARGEPAARARGEPLGLEESLPDEGTGPYRTLEAGRTRPSPTLEVRRIRNLEA